MICVLAAQLAAAHPPFGEELEREEFDKDDVAGWNVQDVYEKLLGEPLRRCAAPDRRMVMLIDALDECERDRTNRVLEVIARSSRACLAGGLVDQRTPSSSGSRS